MGALELRRLPDKGRALFATRDIAEGEVIAVCPLLVLGEDDAKQVAGTMLDHYVFDHYEGRSAIALGYGSLFNHSTDACVDWRSAADDASSYEFFATRDIAKGEELEINYGYDPMAWNDSPMASNHSDLPTRTKSMDTIKASDLKDALTAGKKGQTISENPNINKKKTGPARQSVKSSEMDSVIGESREDREKHMEKKRQQKQRHLNRKPGEYD